jgi:AraC-like DNA-binding protein
MLQRLQSASPRFRRHRGTRWVKENFTQPLRIDDLAGQPNMSTLTFHHHSRALAAVSQLQYQK